MPETSKKAERLRLYCNQQDVPVYHTGNLAVTLGTR